MPINRFQGGMKAGRYLSGGTKTTNALDALSNVGGSMSDAFMGVMGMIPQVGVPLVAGAAIGTTMRNNMPQSSFTSGRGSGARATSNPKQNVPNPTGGTMGGLPSDYKETEASAFASAARHRGQMADIRGGGGDTSSGRKPLPRQILPVEETRKIPGGGEQTGKNLGGGVSTAFVPEYANSSFNDLLAGVNTSGYQPFGSNQLPTTAGSPDAGITPKTKAILAGIQAGKKTDMSIEGYQEPTTSRTDAQNGVLAGIQAGQQTDRSIDGYKGQNYTTIQPDDPQFAAAFGQDLADKYQKEGGSKVTGYTKGGRLDQALSDTAGINSYMSKFSSGDQERLANRAFLDTEGSMAGLRAKEAVNGVVYAGGNHYVAGESADSPAVRIDRSDARDISNNKAKAEQFKSKKVADTIAATKQEPPTLESAASSQAFKQDKPMSATMPGDIGGKTEYYSNNDNVIEPFGGPKGYKSGFKRIDTSMTKPFGG
jgi:hypothetical protein